MKHLILLLTIIASTSFASFSQVSKINSTPGTVTNVPPAGTHLDRTFTFSPAEFSGCASLTEVEISIHLIIGNGTVPTPGPYGVHEDLNVRLVSPSGTIVDLVQDRWGYWTGDPTQLSSYNGFTAVDATVNFDDDHAISIVPVGGGPGTDNWTAGDYSPHNPLSSFDGEDPAGTWTLRVSDGNSQFAANDYIHFVSATLTVTCGSICTDPTVPTLTSTPATVCTGGTATLNITGTLNDATAWQVYTGSCGGTNIGSTATGTFAIPGPITVPTTYFVRGEGGCVTPGTCGSITITPQALDDPSFSYSAASYCVSDADPTPTITGLGGGSFSSSPAGLSINAATGQIDVSASTPNTYTVTYTTSGACPNSSNVAVTINALDDPSFSYSAASYCVSDADPTPTITGLGGGTFSSSPAGLSINATTGQIDVSASTPNTYTVTYTTSGACPNSSNVAVTINALDDASFTYSAATYCQTDADPTPTITGLPGGTFSSTAGLSINATTGQIDVSASTPNTYTVTYATTGTCPNASNVAVTIQNPTPASFTALSDLCINAGIQAGLGGGSPTGGVYSGPGVTDDGNGMTYSFDPAAAGVGVHTITYTPSGGCLTAGSDQVEVFALPTVMFTASGPYCVSQGVQTGLGGGTPTGGVYSGVGVTDDGNGMTYSFDPAAAGVGTHNVTYTFTNGNGCTSSASDAITVTSGGAVTAVCQDISVFLDASGNATITAADIDGGSSVGCGTLNLAASQTTFTCADISSGATPTNDLLITGVYDASLTGGLPKGVELYVINDIADLSQYGLGSANNGGGTDGEEFTFPAVSATAGQYIYVASEAVEFTNWFGFSPDYTSGSMLINGDDAVELFFQGGVIDVFGDINTDGTGEVWDYLDGWAYRINDTGNDGSAWTPSNWTYSGINVFDGETSNATAATPFPVGTFSMTVAEPTSVTLTVTDGLGGSATCTANVTVLDTISPTVNCQDATVYLDATGNATITPADVTNQSFLYFTSFNNNIYQASKNGTGTPTILYGSGTSNDLLVGIDYIPETDELMWANGLAAEITTAPSDGTGPIAILANSQGTGANAVHSSDVDYVNNRYFFSANGNGVYVAGLDGLGTPTLINSTVTGLNTVEYDAANARIFTNSVGGSEIYSMNDNGTGLTTLFTSADGVSGPRDIVYDPALDAIFWTNRDANNIMMGNADGTGTPTVVYSGLTGLYEIELDPTSGMLYWIESSAIKSAPKDGSGTPVILYSGISSLRGLALENGGNTDNCSTPIASIDISTFDCADVGSTVAVTLTVTDDSGNSASCTSQVTVLDTISPIVTCPVDIIEDQGAGVCSADILIPNIVTSDNCAGETISWSVSGATTASGSGQPGLQTFFVGLSIVDVTATDASGNTASCSFTVTVNDTVAPAIPVLADSVAECSVTVAAPTTTDNCNGVITGTTTDPTTVSTQGTTVITWTFDDGAGNISTATQNVIINDAIAPTASNLDTVYAECLGDVVVDVTLVDDEADNCTAVPAVAYVGDVASNGTGCNDTITRTYSVTDDAGNSTTVQQIIIVNDTTAPTASNPITLSVVCLSDVPSTTGSAAWVTDEADNCSVPTVTWISDVSSNGTGCNDTITRTFEVADACGNSIQVQQLIIINDDVAPVLDSPTLADEVGYCDVTPLAPTATDNCLGTINGVPDVTFPINTIGTTVVTWTFTDACGNTVSQTQNVVVEGVNTNVFMASDNITFVAANNDPGVTFQWYDCAAGTIVAGETNQNFTPSYGSDFAVIVTQDGCVDTSDCMNSTVGLDQLTLTQGFTMYPNPTETGSFTIKVAADLKEVSVLDMTGRLVTVNVNLTEKTVDVSNLVNGAYLVRVITHQGQELVGTVRVQ